MMKRLLMVITTVLGLLSPAIAYAQEDPPTIAVPALPTPTTTPAAGPQLGDGTGGIDDGLPTGGYRPTPSTYNWSLPSFPAVTSPTPNGYSAVGDGPQPTTTPVFSQSDEVDSSIDDLDGLTDAPPALVDADGNPIDVSAQIAQYVNDAYLFFSYLKGLQLEQYGKIGEMVMFGMVMVILFYGLKTLLWLWPIIGRLIGWLRRVVKLIMDIIRTLLPG